MKFHLVCLVLLIFSCSKDTENSPCIGDIGTFTYVGEETQDSFIWEPIELVGEMIKIGAYQVRPDFLLTERLIIEIPANEGTIDLNSDQLSRVTYRHIFEDYLGDSFLLDETKESSIQIIEFDRVAQRIGILFNIHFRISERQTYPWSDTVSFIDGQVCKPYSETR